MRMGDTASGKIYCIDKEGNFSKFEGDFPQPVAAPLKTAFKK
jgi:hypothetical protein